MISLILPYWCRQAATDEALRLMATHYHDLELEVVVVDDGSPEPFIEPKSWGLNLKVVRLPTKGMALDSCVPYNRGVEASSGDFIALSSPEMLHHEPILGAMMAECRDENDYVIAACWSEEQNRWHCHSSIIRSNNNDVGAYVPRGADYHFMTMMSRKLWDKTGGFDEDYRQGAGYEDPDFVKRLEKAGARFVRRDDLQVIHPRAGAHANWTAEGFARNRALFMSKWTHIDDR